jgi:hypothetical protein
MAHLYLLGRKERAARKVLIRGFRTAIAGCVIRRRRRSFMAALQTVFGDQLVKIIGSFDLIRY